MTTETKTTTFELDTLPDGRFLLTNKNLLHLGAENCLAYSRRRRGGLYAVLAVSSDGKTLMNAHMRATYGRKDDMSKDAFWDPNALFCCANQDAIDEFVKGGFYMLFEPWLKFRRRIGVPLE